MTPQKPRKLWLELGLGGLILAAVIALGVWAWQHYLESYRYAKLEVSEAAAENSMLAATRLLRQHGHRVDSLASLGLLSLDTLPDGILIIGDNHGQFAPTQLRQLQGWIRRGNVLIMTPKAPPRDRQQQPGAKPAGAADAPAHDGDAATSTAPLAAGQPAPGARPAPPPPSTTYAPTVDADPLASSKGVSVRASERLERRCNPADLAFRDGRPPRRDEPTYVRIECYTAPGSDYALTLDTEMRSLQGGKTAAVALDTDRDGRAVAVYAEGRGRLVLTALNFFDNARLQRYDHAELLLALSQLAPAGSHVQIVQRLDILPWYRALWNQFHLAIASLALGLLLWLWAAATRFGPLLPEPRLQRRALLEHVNASGRWLWQAPGGRDTLLDAARAATTSLMLRRAPELLRLTPEEQAQQLAARCRLAAADIRSALHDDAARQAPDFARQISTLQTLREYYAQQQR